MIASQTFRCLNCNEFINDQMQQCRYCSAPVDPNAAAQAAELQSKVNSACSDASYIRTAAVAMYVFLGVSFILGLAYWGFVVVFFAVIFMLVRWQLRFGELQTSDPDYQKAKSSRNVALALWVAAAPLGFIIKPIAEAIIMSFLAD